MTPIPDDLPIEQTLSYKPAQTYSTRKGGASVADTVSRDGGSALPAGLSSSGAAAGSGYALGKLLGRGGMGEVWEAVQVALGRVVAVKRVRLREVGDDASRGRREAEFHHEALISARLEHPNIVPVHDLGADVDGSPLLAMKLVRGEPWDRLLQADFAALPVDEFLARHLPILVSMAQAVAFAHSKGIVHRDLKPSQVMVGRYGEVLLMDWGLAVLVEEGSTEPARPSVEVALPMALLSVGSASNPSGTPVMMAPEQTHDTAERIGTWTDVYLLGGTLYYVLCGKYPHESESSRTAFQLAMAGKVTPPSERAPGRTIPAELEALCLAAMQPDPGDRVAGAEQFVSLVQDWMTGASRRRESLAVLEQVRGGLSATGLDYRSLSAALSNVFRARELWPSNPCVGELSDDILARQAELACENGDLKLARVQAERVEDLPRRTAILQRVGAAEHRAAGQRRQRRLAIAATFVLLLVVIAGGAFFMRRLDAQKDVIESERQVALQLADGSQSLVHFMLEDLRAALDPTNERDAALIKEVATQVLAHFQARDTSSLSRELKLKHAASLLQSASALRDLARFEDALWLATESLRVYTEAGPGDLFHQAGAHQLVGALHRELSHYAEAEEHLKATLELLDRVGAHEEALALRLTTLNSYAIMRGENGDMDGAVELLGQVIAIREDTGDTELLANNLLNRAIMNLNMDKFAPAKVDLERALSLVQDSGDNGSIYHGRILNALGTLAFNEGDNESAQKYLRESLELRRRTMGPRHPDVANVLVNLGDFLRELGSTEEAEAMLSEALSIYGEALGEENHYYARALHNSSGIDIDRGDFEAARGKLEKALGIWERVVGMVHPDRGNTLTRLGDVYRRLGELDKMFEANREAIDINTKVLGPDAMSLAYAWHGYALGLMDNDRFLEGADAMVEARRIFLANRDEHHGEYVHMLGGMIRSLAGEAKARHAEGETILAREAAQRLVSDVDGHIERVTDTFPRQDYCQALWIAGEEVAARAMAAELLARDDASESFRKWAEELGLPAGAPAPAP